MDGNDWNHHKDQPYLNFYRLEPLANALKHESRFVLCEPHKSFAQMVITKVHSDLQTVIPAGTILYRGRLNPLDFRDTSKEIPPFTQSEMGPPPVHLATPGRINPEGISYLYCANDIDTAGSELRPWKGAKITIAEIEIVKDIPIVDLSMNGMAIDTDWRLLYDDFARYFSIQWPPEMKLNYLFPQFFSEHFKAVGLHGVKYKSEFNIGGDNYALFHSADYKIKTTYNIENTDVSYCFYRDTRDETQKRTDWVLAEHLFSGGADLVNAFASCGKPIPDLKDKDES